MHKGCSLSSRLFVRTLDQLSARIFQRGRFRNKGGWPGLALLPDVDLLIDVGIGHQGTSGLYRYFPASKKFFIDPLFEAKKAVETHLKNPDNKFFVCGLSDFIGEDEITIRHPISRSGLNGKASDKCEPRRTVKIDTLDNLFGDLSRRISSGIKIDVEGHELRVLSGGTKFLAACSFIIVESSIGRPRFHGSSKFHEVYNFIAGLGFELVSIRVSKDGVDHCDIAFIRNDLIDE